MSFNNGAGAAGASAWFEDGRNGSRGAASVKLPQFWIESPDSWFGIAEAQFHTRGVTDSLDKFYAVVSYLPLAVARKAKKMINDPPAHNPYGRLRALLTASHTLSDYDRVVKILAMPPLGPGQKPSDLLAEMLDLCPEAEEETHFMRTAFLMRLPAAVRRHLIEERGGLANIAARADVLVDHKDAHLLAAAVEAEDATEESSVAAVRPGQQQIPRRGGRGGFRRGSGGRGGFQNRPQQQQQQQGAQQQPATEPSPSMLARQAAGLCRFHFKFGAGAFSCIPPCQWQGN